MYIELVVTYPPGAGLTKTPVGDFGTASFSINNPGQLPASGPYYFSAQSAQNALDWPHREARILYDTLSITYGPVQADTSIASKSTFELPERAFAVSSVLKNGIAIVGGVTIDTTGKILTFTNAADFTNSGDNITVTFQAVRPFPQNGEQVTLYYNARAPQTVRSALIGTSQQVIPRRSLNHLFTITAGSGSPDEGYPFPYQYVQTGGVYPTSGGNFTGEHEFDALGNIAVNDFSATTGMLQLPIRIPFVPNPESLTLNRSPADTDAEGRSFFKSVPAGYLPNAFAPSLSDPKRHKVVYTALVEIPADTFGKKGLLCLLLLTRFADFDGDNYVAFDSSLALNQTAASLFRVKGNLLVRRV
jgi:hypothetical protein